MKKTIYYFVLVGMVIFSIASSCKKPTKTEEQLPTGENTLYCYVDGNLYIPKTGNSVPPVPAIYYSGCPNDSSFLITARDITLYFYNGIIQTGSIFLNQSNFDACLVHSSHGYYTKEEVNNGIIFTKFYYTHDGSGTIKITYLSNDKRKFKGTFEMTVYHEDTNEEIHITDGHFNINLDTLND